MKTSYRGVLLAGVTALAALVPAVAGAGGGRRVEGEVLALHQAVRTRNGGAYDEITVRTREGREMRLRLGPAGEGSPGCEPGDAIRARLGGRGPEEGAWTVRSMRNVSAGTQQRFRARDGSLIPAGDRARSRLRDGTGDGVPDRTRSGDTGRQRGRASGADGRGGGRGGGR